ncbi:hypothetical protein A2U01_0073115, partial [Trifolium medium]|nr:hypothetical protein [Trifolium medium]
MSNGSVEFELNNEKVIQWLFSVVLKMTWKREVSRKLNTIETDAGGHVASVLWLKAGA